MVSQFCLEKLGNFQNGENVLRDDPKCPAEISTEMENAPPFAILHYLQLSYWNDHDQIEPSLSR